MPRGASLLSHHDAEQSQRCLAFFLRFITAVQLLFQPWKSVSLLESLN